MSNRSAVTGRCSRLFAITFTLIFGGISLHANGIIIDERIGINFNNKYGDPDLKLDWLRFNHEIADAGMLETIADLDTTMPEGYRAFRLGFSRRMAQNPADLAQWADELAVIINAGHHVLLSFWAIAGDITDPVTDAVYWADVMDVIEARGLLHGIVGWEIMNEPQGSGWAEYVQTIWRTVGGYGSTPWENLTVAQKTEIAAAWRDLPVVIQGGSFGQDFSSNLVGKLQSLPNLVWSVHSYVHFSPSEGRDHWSVEDWEAHWLDKWESAQALINGNYIVSEIGVTNLFQKDLTGMGDASTTTEDRKATGFVRAALQRYRYTSVYWYTAYNQANIGVGRDWKTGWRPKNLHATNYMFFDGISAPPIPPGTTNVALNKPVIVDSINSSSTAGALAVDGNRVDPSSRWVSANSAYPHWIEIDLQGQHAISQMRYYTGSNIYESPITSLQLQSWNGANWVTIFLDSSTNNPTYFRHFPTVVTDRVRLRALDGPDNYVRLYELEIYGVPAGDTTVPQPPTDVFATPRDGAIDLDWSDSISSDRSGYNVYRATAPRGPYTQLNNLPVTLWPFYHDTTAINGVTFYYVVTTLDASGNESSDSAEVMAVAGPIINVAAGKPVQVDSVNGSSDGSKAVDGNAWDDSFRWVSDGSSWPHWIEVDLGEVELINEVRFWTGFNGYNQPPSDFRFQYWTGTNWADIFAVSNNENAAFWQKFPGVATDRVRLYATDGPDNFFRLYELEIYAVNDAIPPAAPTNLTSCYDTDTGAVLLDWADNMESDLAGYNVYRSPISGSRYVQIATDVLASEFQDTAVPNILNAYYVVTAADDQGGESTFSNEVDVCTLTGRIPFALDCNRNMILDACDIASGSSADCNDNGLLDECETLTGGDYNHDGVVNVADYWAFENALTGPDIVPTVDAPCLSLHLSVFDNTGDGDIDMRDAVHFQLQYTGG